MISVEDREHIRRAYFIEHKSIRQIAKEQHYSRKTVRKAIESAEPEQYTLSKERPAPVLGKFKEQIDRLLAGNEKMPRKQRYTAHKIFEEVKKAGYSGSESGVRGYIALQRKEKKRPKVFIPLEFDPGMEAQVDWGEAVAIIAGMQTIVQLFIMRLNYSRRMFVRAFPAQKQEAFFEGHECGFHHFQGVPHRIAYDNLKAAVQRVLEGHTRQEQQQFIVFRSHYLFESHFCTPGQGHEKGGVEHGVGFSRRNFMVPIPEVASFEALNTHLLAACLADDLRRVDGHEVTIGQAWEIEKPLLLSLPAKDFSCCVTRAVSLIPYSQVEFETNRYSVPSDEVYQRLVLKAYSFTVKVLHGNEVIAEHPRCYGRNQDIYDPLHYLPLLEQRPGAFEHAKPIRRWRTAWPPIYEQLLAHLRAEEKEGSRTQSIREFVRILKLLRDYPAEPVERAMAQALEFGCAHADGVMLCLHQLLHPDVPTLALNLSDRPQLANIGEQPVDLRLYEQLLETARL